MKDPSEFIKSCTSSLPQVRALQTHRALFDYLQTGPHTRTHLYIGHFSHPYAKEQSQNFTQKKTYPSNVLPRTCPKGDCRFLRCGGKSQLFNMLLKSVILLKTFSVRLVPGSPWQLGICSGQFAWSCSLPGVWKQPIHLCTNLCAQDYEWFSPNVCAGKTQGLNICGKQTQERAQPRPSKFILLDKQMFRRLFFSRV